MGEVVLPESALYGPQTQRALNNFTISDQKMDRRFIHSLLLIKRGAAEANSKLGLLAPEKAAAILAAIDKLEKDEIMVHFPVPVLQTGSGTSTNMNVNEVIANRAIEILGGDRFTTEKPIHPNDHVNLGQSSNDVIPTAVHVSALFAVEGELIPALTHLQGYALKNITLAIIGMDIVYFQHFWPVPRYISWTV